MKAANGAVNTGGKNIMKLITAQELQNMTETEIKNFFNSLSEAQARREAEEGKVSRTVGNVCLKLDLYSEYSFD
jgi:folate-dependent phosphoribosylglycinamide formyltransferase PurN